MGRSGGSAKKLAGKSLSRSQMIARSVADSTSQKTIDLFKDKKHIPEKSRDLFYSKLSWLEETNPNFDHEDIEGLVDRINQINQQERLSVDEIKNFSQQLIESGVVQAIDSGEDSANIAFTLSLIYSDLDPNEINSIVQDFCQRGDEDYLSYVEGWQEDDSLAGAEDLLSISEYRARQIEAEVAGRSEIEDGQSLPSIRGDSSEGQVGLFREITGLAIDNYNAPNDYGFIPGSIKQPRTQPGTYYRVGDRMVPSIREARVVVGDNQEQILRVEEARTEDGQVVSVWNGDDSVQVAVSKNPVDSSRLKIAAKININGNEKVEDLTDDYQNAVSPGQIDDMALRIYKNEISFLNNDPESQVDRLLD